jgi:hypothetical protein
VRSSLAPSMNLNRKSAAPDALARRLYAIEFLGVSLNT